VTGYKGNFTLFTLNRIVHGPHIESGSFRERKISLPTLYSMEESHGFINIISIVITQRCTPGRTKIIVLL
jgi:hypothetical protein